MHKNGAEHQDPDALSRAIENNFDIVALTPRDMTGPWYIRRINSFKNTPAKYPIWRIENVLLYVHHSNNLIDLFFPDLDAWKLVVPTAHREKILFEA